MFQFCTDGPHQNWATSIKELTMGRFTMFGGQILEKVGLLKTQAFGGSLDGLFFSANLAPLDWRSNWRPQTSAFFAPSSQT